MDPYDPSRPDQPLYGLHVGTVTNRDDPEGLARVRVTIPGLIEPQSAWARPLGTLNGGAAQRGAVMVPPVGADVGVFFKMGDVDQPYYIGAGFARNEQLTQTEGSPDVHQIETAKYAIQIDDRAATENLTIVHKSSGNLIQLNGVERSIKIRATAMVDIESDGFIQLNGLRVIVNGQPAGLGKL